MRMCGMPLVTCLARTPHWPDNMVSGAKKAVPFVLAGMHAVHLPDDERPKCLFTFDLSWPPWCHDKLDSTDQHFATDLLGESTTTVRGADFLA